MASNRDNLLYGATILGHTVEGENYASDWWRWEQRPGRIASGATSQTAAGHWPQFQDDAKLASTLGLNCLLVSVEWSRIEPKRGEFDPDALQHYVRVLKTLTKHNITPIVALQAITLPAWFADAGGWAQEDATDLFGLYVKEAVRTLSPHCRHWIPLYRVLESLKLGYVERLWPPGRSNVLALAAPVRHVRQTVFLASDTILGIDPNAQIGISIEMPDVLPYDEESPWDYRASREINELDSLGLFLNVGLLGQFDFLRLCLDPNVELGLGDAIEGADDGEEQDIFHFRVVPMPGSRWVRLAPTAIRRGFVQPVDEHCADVDFRHRQPDAARLSTVMQDFQSDDIPILFIGGAHDFTDDRERCAYLLDHIEAVNDLKNSGQNVLGYVHESYLDGFEWDRGYSTRRGLVHIDWETLARTPNPSAYLLGDIARQGGITPGAIRNYCHGWQSRLEPVR